jgi:hypothetical protein
LNDETDPWAFWSYWISPRDDATDWAEPDDPSSYVRIRTGPARISYSFGVMFPPTDIPTIERIFRRALSPPSPSV